MSDLVTSIIFIYACSCFCICDRNEVLKTQTWPSFSSFLRHPQASEQYIKQKHRHTSVVVTWEEPKDAKELVGYYIESSIGGSGQVGTLQQPCEGTRGNRTMSGSGTGGSGWSHRGCRERNAAMDPNSSTNIQRRRLLNVMLWVSQIFKIEYVYGHTFEERITSDIKHLETHNGSYDRGHFIALFWFLHFILYILWNLLFTFNIQCDARFQGI